MERAGDPARPLAAGLELCGTRMRTAVAFRWEDVDPEAGGVHIRDQSNSAKALASIIKGSGFRWATPHSFRRTVATLLDQAGVPIATIADRLGHTDPAVTASKYLGRDLMGDKPSVAEHL